MSSSVFPITLEHAELFLALLQPLLNGDSENLTEHAALAEGLAAFVRTQSETPTPSAAHSPLQAVHQVALADSEGDLATAGNAFSRSSSVTLREPSLSPSLPTLSNPFTIRIPPVRPLPTSVQPPPSPLKIRLPARSAHYAPYPARMSADSDGEGQRNSDLTGDGPRAGRLRGGAQARRKCSRKGKKARLAREKRQSGVALQMGPEYGEAGDMDQDGDTSDNGDQISENATDTGVAEDVMESSSEDESRRFALNNGMPMEEEVKLCDFSRGILNSICSAADDCVSPNGYSRYAANVHDLVKNAVLGHSPSIDREQLATFQSQMGSDASLIGLATLCQENEKLETEVQLAGYFGAMEFAAHVQWRLRSLPCYRGADGRRRKQTKTHMFRDISALLYKQSGGKKTISEHSLNRYYHVGSKCRMLAGAGSMYIVFLMAVSKVRNALTIVSGSTLAELARIIRRPDDSVIGKKVKESLIPAIVHLRKVYPLSLDLFFTPSFVASAGEGVKLDSTDLEASDRFFDSFGYDFTITPRCSESWHHACEPVSDGRLWSLADVKVMHTEALSRGITLAELLALSEVVSSTSSTSFDHPVSDRPDQWDSTIANAETFTVETGFDPRSPQNRTPLRNLSEEERQKLTDSHREGATCAKQPTDLPSLVDTIEAQLLGGAKSHKDEYTLVDTALFPDKILRINDKDGGLMAMIVATMPEELRKAVFTAVRLIFDDILKHVDSRALLEFLTIHFSYYNRYAKQGTGTPAEAHPSSIRMEGKKHVNSRVGFPRESDEAKEWQSYKDKLQECFSPMFAWIEKTLQSLLPETFTVLEQSVDILPLGDSVLAHPFTGFVLNFNVSTVIHRDYCDKEICMVFQISDCEGGELCLVEPGLVIRLRNGDGVIFRSHEITHFNNHFIGRRMSLVFHTDGGMDTWMDNYNDWGHNVYFRASRCLNSNPDTPV